MALTRRQLADRAEVVAPRLLGARLVSVVGGPRVVLRITEVEAYAGVGEDPGSHAFRGRTARNTTLFGAAGLMYVYFTYGMHWCANVVCGREGSAAALLVRAGEIVEGESVAFERRPSARRSVDLARGPARLTKALGIGGDLDGLDLFGRTSPVRLLGGERVPSAVVRTGPRTGIRGAGAGTPWRFWIDGDPTVSPYRPAAVRATG